MGTQGHAHGQEREQGQQVLEIVGQGDRQYLTGLKLGGERTLILVDRSASMLDDTIINIIRRRNMPVDDKLRAVKWRQAVASVDWLTAQFAPGSEFQIYMYNTTADVDALIRSLHKVQELFG